MTLIPRIARLFRSRPWALDPMKVRGVRVQRQGTRNRWFYTHPTQTSPSKRSLELLQSRAFGVYFDTSWFRVRQKLLNFIDFFGLTYFSYTSSLLQRSGHKAYYWHMLCNVLRETTQIVSREYSGLGINAINHKVRVKNETLPTGMPFQIVQPDVVGVQQLVMFFWLKGYISKAFTSGAALVGDTKITLSSLSHPQIFALMCSILKLSYVVKYKALDRKLRKIVKNKYRYFRFYSMLSPNSRIKAGLRLLLLGLSLRSNQNVYNRLLELCVDLFLNPEHSLLVSLRKRHQLLTLTTLTLAL
jgi:hypothetical protein